MDSMSITNELISIAKKRLERYQRLVALAKEQESILLENRHADLPGNIAEFDPLLMEIKRIDDAEQSLARQINDLDEEEPVRLLGMDPRYDRLLQLTNVQASKLRELAHSNAEMLENAMQFVNFSIGIVCKIAADERQLPDNGNNPAIVLDLKV